MLDPHGGSIKSYIKKIDPDLLVLKIRMVSHRHVQI